MSAVATQLDRLSAALSRTPESEHTTKMWHARLEAAAVRTAELQRAVDELVDTQQRFPAIADVLDVIHRHRSARSKRLRDDSRRLLTFLERHAPELYDQIAVAADDERLAQDVARDLGLVDQVRDVLRRQGVSYESRAVPERNTEVIS